MSIYGHDEEREMTTEEWVECHFGTPGNHTDDGECPVDECTACGTRDCPHGAPEHHWRDGCPTCYIHTNKIAK